MTLAELHAEVAALAKRGTALDAVIPGMVRRAVRFLETNHTFAHMRRYAEITVKTTVDYPRAIAFPSKRVKEFDWARWAREDGKFFYLEHVDGRDVTEISTGRATAFWLDALNYLYLDATPDEEYEIQVTWNEFSDWPTATGGTPVFLARHEGLLLAETMLAVAGFKENTTGISFWRNTRDTELVAALAADQALDDGGRSQERMLPVELYEETQL